MKRLNEHSNSSGHFILEELLEEKKDDSIIHTMSSNAINMANDDGEGGIDKQINGGGCGNEGHKVYKSVNVSVNNMLSKNKTGATGGRQMKQLLDIKQILEQRGSKCTCMVPLKGRIISPNQ